MRTLTITLFTLMSLILNQKTLTAQTTTEAVEYMNEVFGPITELKGETWQYLKAVTRGKGARKVENKRQNLINKIKTEKTEASRVKGFHGDETVKNAVIQYLDMSYTVLKEDFGKILDMEDIAEQSYDAMEAYLLAKEKANEKLHDAFDVVAKAQTDFAAANEIELLEADEDKTTEKINKASAALKYYNEVYLIFFKCYKQEAYIIDAQQRNDVNAIEQNNNSLVAFAEEGIDKVKKLENYLNDPSLKNAAREILTFYLNEAEKDFPSIVDFYLKKDNFEKVRKMVDSKSKKDKTQEDIDKYNKAMEEYNAAVQTYNNSNNTMNEKRGKSLDSWNKKVEGFFDVHTK